MKKLLIFALAAVCLSSCFIEKREPEIVTPTKLQEFADYTILKFVVGPANELATFLFVDECMDLDEAGINSLALYYGIAGKVHQADPETFVIDNFGQIKTGGEPFEKDGWDTGWVKTGPDEWVKNDQVLVNVSYAESGRMNSFTVSFDLVEAETYGFCTSTVSLPDGPVSMDNPLKYCIETGAPSWHKPQNPVKIHGKVRIETRELERLVDWVEVTADGAGTRTYKTSRD